MSTLHRTTQPLRWLSMSCFRKRLPAWSIIPALAVLVVTGTRELVAHQNYILIYDMADDLVRVLRVLHAARKWPPTRNTTEK